MIAKGFGFTDAPTINCNDGLHSRADNLQKVTKAGKVISSAAMAACKVFATRPHQRSLTKARKNFPQ